MAIRCGKCRESHETVAEVKACYGVQNVSHSRPGDRDWRSEPASTGQYETLRRLREQTGSEPEFTGQITKGQADQEIKELIETAKVMREMARSAHRPGLRPPSAVDHADDPSIRMGIGTTQRTPRPRVSDWPDVPAAWYATPSHTGSNDLDFWSVTHGKEGGRWAGYVFVERVIGGRDNQRIRTDEQIVALEAIRKAGPEAAMALFGQELGKCGKCGRHLTDEVSRQYGIGPVCRAGGRDS